MTAVGRKGLEQQGKHPHRQNMASQTQDKSHHGPPVNYEAADHSNLRYPYDSTSSTTPVPTTQTTTPTTITITTTTTTTTTTPDRDLQPTPSSETPQDKSQTRPQRMGIQRKRSGSEFRADDPTGSWHGKEDVKSRKGMTVSEVKTEPSDADIMANLRNWIEKTSTGAKGSRMAYNFEHAALYPPITKQSLSELDIASIINNPKLRHDVNFDRELHFRPNFDGAKGKLKLRTAEEYWSALAAELELYAVLLDDSKFVGVCGEASKAAVLRVARKRIPLMFDTIRDIIRNLVPECDQARVEEQLDTPMLMQQIQRGVCDLASIASWLSHLLKAHCAPVRDEWVDKMVEQIDTGTRSGNGRMMVNGLRELLGILEAMKLDVANHQIRHLRALLIEDTVNFEQKYHLERISRRRILVDRSQHWYALQEVDQQDLATNPKCKDPGSRVLTQGLLSLLTSGDRQRPFPETFYLDFERLRVLRAEFRDQVHLRMCSETFASLVRRLGHKDSVSAHTQKTLRETLYALVPIVENSGSSSIQHWLVNIDNIAVELVRRALSMCGQAAEYDGELVRIVSAQLRRLISMDNGREFADYARPLKDTLASLVLDSAGSCASLSPVDIFNFLIMPNSPSSPRAGRMSSELAAGDSKETPAEKHLADIARRITHIAVVHWQIWGPIVYAQAASILSAHELSPAQSPTESSFTNDNAVEPTITPPRRWSSPDGRRTPGVGDMTEVGSNTVLGSATSSAPAQEPTDSSSDPTSGMPLVYRQR